MKFHLTFPAFLLALLLQSTVLFSVGAVRLRPDLLLLLVVAIGVLSGSVRAIVWAVLAGLLMDLTSAAPTGAHLLALLPVALLTLARESDLVEGRLTLAMALAFVATFVYDAAFLAVLEITGHRVEWLGSLFWIMLPGAVLNTIVMPLVFWAARPMVLPPLTRTPAYAAA